MSSKTREHESRTVHLVYPAGQRLGPPDAIGRTLQRFLAMSYRVITHEWDEVTLVRPAPGDALIGHPHPFPGTIFRRSARLPGWSRKLALAPYSHGPNRLGQAAFLDDVIPWCDLFLAITGRYWFESVGESPFSHWLPKMVHLDLAIDRRDYPVSKSLFSPAGRRKVLYIGNMGSGKNASYLEQIAAHCPNIEFGWMGSHPGRSSLRGFRSLGQQDFRSDCARALAAEYDFLIAAGDSDANPTSILEAMAWGLVPVCTRESGYSEYSSIPNLPLNDPPGASVILRKLQHLDESTLRRWQQHNWDALDTHFRWDRFAGQVLAALESSSSPELGKRTMSRRRLRWEAAKGPLSPFKPRASARLITRQLRRL